MHRIASKSGARALRPRRHGRLVRRPPPSRSAPPIPRRALSTLPVAASIALPPPPASCHRQRSARSLWSPSGLAAEAAATDAPAPASPLHVPPRAPSHLAASSLIDSSTLEALQALPECQSAMDVLNGAEEALAPAKVKEAPSNLQRARDILQSMPELALATHLLEVDLLCLQGKFEMALEGLARYEHLKSSEGTMGAEERTRLQFLKAKLMVHLGQFTHALSEYEFLLEDMERAVDEQVQLQEEQEQEQEKENNEASPIPVINGAAALTGVGVSNLLIRLRDGADNGTHSDEGEIIESLETATDMLLESRKDALLSPKHSQLAVDLGLAASIALTNLGVAHCLLHNDMQQSIKLWKQGLTTLDSILEGAMRSATVVPNHKHQCMEGVRARLQCNISWALLGGGNGKLEEVDDETLKGASSAAKKALDIYDELINGSKVLRTGEANLDDDEDDSQSEETDEDATSREEWERILKEKAEGMDATSGTKPSDLPLSSLWTSHHRCESARALGLVAQCYAAAGAAVTAEGLFQSALGASSSHPLGQPLRSRGGSDGNGVSLASPSLGLIARDVRLGYATLCDRWEKRKGDDGRLRADAQTIEDEGVLRGFVRDEDGTRKSVSGLTSALWLFGPSDFDR